MPGARLDLSAECVINSRIGSESVQSIQKLCQTHVKNFPQYNLQFGATASIIYLVNSQKGGIHGILNGPAAHTQPSGIGLAGAAKELDGF